MFTDRQKSIVYGSLLGDAHLTAIRTQNGNSSFTKNQCEKRKEYLLWHFDELLPYSCSIKDKIIYLNSKKHPQSCFRAFSCPEFKLLRLKWYPDGKKVVPSDLVLDPLLIAIWFADDGQNSPGQALFHTQGFCKDDREFLISLLSLLGIYSYTNKTKRIYIRGNCYSKFIDLISPYFVWKCFKHKIDKTSYQPEYNTLCEELAVKVFEYYDQGLRQSQIAEIFGVDSSSISDILRGNSYSQLGLSKARPGVHLNSYYGKGISFDKTRKKWRAYVGKKYLGRFATAEEAKCARGAELKKKGS